MQGQAGRAGGPLGENIYLQHLCLKTNTIYKVGGSKPALDMAILAACNHSLVDYGTFSVWGAYLAKGEVVVANYRR